MPTGNSLAAQNSTITNFYGSASNTSPPVGSPKRKLNSKSSNASNSPSKKSPELKKRGIGEDTDMAVA